MGWFFPDPLNLTSDFTLHTRSGMQGQSFDDAIEQVLVVDPKAKFTNFEDHELVDVDINQALDAFNKFSSHTLNFHKYYKPDEHEGVIFISLKPEYIFIQSENNSVRISKAGVFVIDRNDENLVLISERDGIRVINEGERVVEINDEGSIHINGKELNPHTIVNHITKKISQAFSDINF
jgi:hypothetical protein